MASPDIAAILLRRFTSEASADDSFESPGAQASTRYYGKKGAKARLKVNHYKSTIYRHNLPMVKTPQGRWKAQLIF